MKQSIEKQIKQQIKQQILDLQDPAYKQFHQNLCPTTNKEIIGVRIPILRNYAKDLLKQYDAQTLLNNIDNEYYEEIMLQGMIIGLSKQKDFHTCAKQIEKFIPKIDNWAICDTFCAGLKITKKHKQEMWEIIQKYVKSQEEFEIRFGIVMILDYYVESEYLQDIFKIFDNVKSDKYYVQMAVAWAISICLIKYYDETKMYLKTANLDNFTYNKAIQKAIESFRVTEEQKEELREMKR